MENKKLIEFFKTLTEQPNMYKAYDKIVPELTPDQKELVSTIMHTISQIENTTANLTFNAATAIASLNIAPNDVDVEDICKFLIYNNVGLQKISKFLGLCGVGIPQGIAFILTFRALLGKVSNDDELDRYNDMSLDELNKELDEQLKNYKDD